MNINSIILAAGKGTRMKSLRPKVIHPLLGYEMINLVLKALTEAGVNNNLLVLGYKKEEVLKKIDKKFIFDYVEQTEQLGTGDAVKQTKSKLISNEGITIITCGDAPLIKPDTFKNLISEHLDKNNDLTILTTILDSPFGYGRIVRDHNNDIIKIVEQKEANENEQEICEINTGVYIFDNKKLMEYIDQIDNNNQQNEYYLTDLISLFKANNHKIGSYITDDSEETLGINDLVALERANKILQKRINKYHQLNGVHIVDSSATYIGPNVEIGIGTLIPPGNSILGYCVIGTDVNLLSNNHITSSNIGSGTSIGPSAHLRERTSIGENCRIGNFVEIKNSQIGNRTKCAHLTYLGDAQIGEDCNIGCGVITANYDGEHKYKTKIGNHVFIGSNVNLIAPLEVKDNSFLAAGATITENIDEQSFVIDRNPLRIKKRRYDV